MIKAAISALFAVACVAKISSNCFIETPLVGSKVGYRESDIKVLAKWDALDEMRNITINIYREQQDIGLYIARSDY